MERPNETRLDRSRHRAASPRKIGGGHNQVTRNIASLAFALVEATRRSTVSMWSIFPGEKVIDL
jgi:hypothetical protein